MAIPVRTLIIGLAVLLVGGIAIALTMHEKESTSCADSSPQPRITAFGDSLVTGYGATIPGGFVSLLSKKTGISIANLGKNGETTAQAKIRLQQVIDTTPAITLVLLGGNDALQQVPPAETEQNLSEIVSTLQKSGSKVIVLGVIGAFPRDLYAPMFTRIAKEYNVTYIPNVLSGILGHPDLMSDSVHR